MSDSEKMSRTRGSQDRDKSILADARRRLAGEPEAVEEPAVHPIVADRPSLDEAGVTYAIPPDQYRSEMRAKVWRDAAELHMDETIPGGRYMVGGVLVDCNGKPIK
jgi:hypothetical protein